MEQKGQKNAYTCAKCGESFVTVNLDDGTTPFMSECRSLWPKLCGGMARSQMYRIDQQSPAEWGWYKPDELETNRLEYMHPGISGHIQQGGLILRRLDNAERETYGGNAVRKG